MKKNIKTNENVLYQIAEKQQGLFTARQAISAGYDERNHLYYVQSGRWIKEKRGIYRLKHFPYLPDSQFVLWSLWTSNRKGKVQGVYSHQTALQIYELSDLSPSKLHITVPKKFRKSIPTPSILTLYKKDLKPSDYRAMAGFRVTTPSRTLYDMISSKDTSKEFIVQIIEEGMSRGLFPKQQLKKYKLLRKVKSYIKDVNVA